MAHQWQCFLWLIVDTRPQPQKRGMRTLIWHILVRSRGFSILKFLGLKAEQNHGSCLNIFKIQEQTHESVIILIWPKTNASCVWWWIWCLRQDESFNLTYFGQRILKFMCLIKITTVILMCLSFKRNHMTHEKNKVWHYSNMAQNQWFLCSVVDMKSQPQTRGMRALSFDFRYFG